MSIYLKDVPTNWQCHSYNSPRHVFIFFLWYIYILKCYNVGPLLSLHIKAYWLFDAMRRRRLSNENSITFDIVISTMQTVFYLLLQPLTIDTFYFVSDKEFTFRWKEIVALRRYCSQSQYCLHILGNRLKYTYFFFEVNSQSEKITSLWYFIYAIVIVNLIKHTIEILLKVFQNLYN